ncbi:hypothetical protein JW766_01115 [Candidatus Dojkabacteria bacterium]|nr:hypothetical protein [Candidatus Dojkabacteria bacterium]
MDNQIIQNQVSDNPNSQNTGVGAVTTPYPFASANPMSYSPQVPTQRGQQVSNIPQVPVQQIQPVIPGASPEVPSRVEGGERLVVPEVKVEPEKGSEALKEERVEEEKKEKAVEAPNVVPDQQKFESPFKVYGYQLSRNASLAGQKTQGNKVKGDVFSAKTWLFVLINRLVRMYKTES